MQSKMNVFEDAFKRIFEKDVSNINAVEKARMFTMFCFVWDVQQAKIDRLMLEHCPEEMSAEQLEEWGEHQRVSSVDLPAFNMKLIP